MIRQSRESFLLPGREGALKGAIIGLVILFLYVLTRRTVKTGKEIKTHLNLVDLGTLPEVHVKKRNKESFYNSVNVLNKRIPQGYLEAFRKVGIKVMKQMEEEEFKTLFGHQLCAGRRKDGIFCESGNHRGKTREKCHTCRL